jgi:hypothetical protein
MLMERAAHKRTTVGITDTELLPQNSHRTGLIFSPPQAGAYDLSFTDPASLGGGIRVAAGTTPLILTTKQHGDWIKGSVRAIADGGPVTVGVTEIVGP